MKLIPTCSGSIVTCGRSLGWFQGSLGLEACDSGRNSHFRDYQCSSQALVSLLSALYLYWCVLTPNVEKAMTLHSSTLAWKIPWTEEPCGLPSVGSHRVGHDWSDLAAAAATPNVDVTNIWDGHHWVFLFLGPAESSGNFDSLIMVLFSHPQLMHLPGKADVFPKEKNGADCCHKSLPKSALNCPWTSDNKSNCYK